MATIEPNRCYICKKLFCCIDCCSNHIKNKHFECECSCPLCRGEPLIIRHFHHQTFLCHVVFNHLPLYCRACGKLFQNHEDLKNLNTCKHRPLIKIEPPSFTNIETSNSDVDSPPVIIKTPSNLFVLKKSFSWTGSDTSYFKNSPPASTRHTSTPMNIGFFKQKFSSISKSPNIILKTPKTSVCTPSNDGEKEELNNQQSNNQSQKESVYFDFSITRSASDCTPLRSILSSRSLHRDISQQNFFRSISERRLEAMQESDETGIDVKDVLSSSETNYSDQESLQSAMGSCKSRKDNKDSEKKVRFSDQFNTKSNINEPEDINSNTIDVTVLEEFFEACQSFSDTSSIPVKNLPNSISNTEHKENCKDSEEKKNNKSYEEINETTDMKKSPKMKNCSSKSSRVVMMVLMEKTGDISVKELSPLINSSLKKLESIVSNPSSSLDKLQSPKDKSGKKNGLTMVSVDSYSCSSSVECFEASETINIPLKNQQSIKQNNSGGIFAAVANAVKNAFKNLSGATTAKSFSNAANNFSTSSTSSLPSPIQHSTFISCDETSSISESRSSKRPREDNDFALALTDKSDHQNLDPLSIVRSPVQKKARGWYKQIRGRQPIARMKDNSYVCPRGISDETQCFQKGAFTVKDTILPVPARALQVNQSTQTDF